MTEATMAGQNIAGQNITEVWVDGAHMWIGLGRLDHAYTLLGRRRAALDAAGTAGLERKLNDRYEGDAFRVHLSGSIDTILEHDEAMVMLCAIAEHGERCGVVALVHGDRAAIMRAFTRDLSGRLTAALVAGRSFRHIEPTFPPGLSESETERAAEAVLVAAKLATDYHQQPERLAQALDAALGQASEDSRLMMAVALHAAADMISVGDLPA